MNNKAKEFFKGALSVFAGFGITVMAKTGINMLTPETAGKITQMACKVGGYLVAGAVARVATNEIDKIDKDMEEMKKTMIESITQSTKEEEEKTDEDHAAES